jgi:hypothetical protein
MNPDDPRQVDAAFAAHKREQARRGLSMTPFERLRWLERTVGELRRLQALAKAAKHADTRSQAEQAILRAR